MRFASWALAFSIVASLAGAPALADDRGTPDQAKALVEKAAAHMKDVGAEKALADFDDPKGGYQDRDLFVFVYGPDNKIVGSAGVPALRGKDVTLLKDVDGKEFGKLIIATAAGECRGRLGRVPHDQSGHQESRAEEDLRHQGRRLHPRGRRVQPLNAVMGMGAMRFRLHDIPISTKVAFAPGFVVCTLIGMALFAIAILGASKERTRDLSEGAFERYRLAAEANEATANAHTMLIRTLSVAANELDKKRIEAKIKTVTAASSATLSALQGLERHVGTDDPAMRQIVAAFKLYSEAAKQVLDVVADDPATGTMLMADAEESFDKLGTQLSALKRSADAARVETSRAALDAATQASWLFLAILITAALLSIVATALISRAISRPIKQLTHDMEMLASGSTEIAITATGQKDEIGSMARAVEVFKQNAIDKARLDADQKAEQTRKEQRQTAIEQYIAEFERSVRASLAALVSAAAEMRATSQSHVGDRRGDQPAGDRRGRRGRAGLGQRADGGDGDRGAVVVGVRDQPPGGQSTQDRRRGGGARRAGPTRRSASLVGGGAEDRRRGEADQRHRRARPICWRSTPPSRRRAPARPARASRWWPRR